MATACRDHPHTLGVPVCLNASVDFPASQSLSAETAPWDKVAELMSSKELMLKQIERWAARRRERPEASMIEVDTMQKEVAKLKKQEDRFARAYAEGLFSVGKLQEYLTPLREKIASLDRNQSEIEEQFILPEWKEV